MADGTDGSQDMLKGRSPVKAVADLLDTLGQDVDNGEGDGEGDNTEIDLKGAGNTEDEGDGQNTDPNTESDDEGEGENEGASATGEEVEIDSSTLASLLGIDESDIIVGEDGSPRFRAKVDGQDKEISFDSLLRNYRLQQHVDNNATEVKQQREALQDEREQMRTAYLSAIQQAATFITAQEEELVRQFQSINWEQKKAENPTQYVIDREAFREKLQSFQQKRLELGQKWEEEQTKRSAEFQKFAEDNIAEQAKLILEKIPEWNDKSIAKTESEQLKQYAKENGFTDAELSQLIDHRAWFFLRKAMLYDRTVGKVKETVKKVATLPKVTKPKAPGDVNAGRKARLAKSKEKAMTGKRSDQVAFVNELLAGNSRGN